MKLSNGWLNKTRREIWAATPDGISVFFATLDEIKAGYVSGDEDRSHAVVATSSGSIASVPVRGMILRKRSELLDWFGVEHTGLAELASAIMSAAEDDDVEEIELDIDSPGGVASGVGEVADLIASVAKTKKVVAKIDTMAASAAYWLASQATEIVASKYSDVGSIGVYQVVVDSSDAAAAGGYKVNVISTHELKGIGVDGAPLTDTQRADVQRRVNDVFGEFVAAVASGRGMSSEAVASVATGQTWSGKEALELGLVDKLVSLGGMVPPVEDTANAEKTREMAMSEEKANAVHAAAEMERQLAEQRAQLEKLKLESDILRKAQVSALIDQYAAAGVVTPVLRPEIEKLAASHTPDEVRSLLDKLPKQTNAARVASEQSAVSVTQQPAAQDKGEAQVCRWLGTSQKRIEATAQVASYRSDGKFVLTDGSVVTKEELKGMVR